MTKSPGKDKSQKETKYISEDTERKRKIVIKKSGKKKGKKENHNKSEQIENWLIIKFFKDKITQITSKYYSDCLVKNQTQIINRPKKLKSCGDGNNY